MSPARILFEALDVAQAAVEELDLSPLHGLDPNASESLSDAQILQTLTEVLLP